jgi:hypothetical protein
MNGYEYLVQRNKLMIKFEDDCARLNNSNLAEPERERENKRLQVEFDAAVAELYAKVTDEFPGERKKKARPISDPR